MAREVRQQGAEVIALGLTGGRRPDAFPRVVRALRELRPDVVYAFLFTGYCLALPAASVLSPKPLRVQGRRSLPAADIPRTSSLRWLRRVADRMTDAVVANSQAVADACLENNPRLRDRMYVIHNGVRIPPMPAALGEQTGRARILCVANLISYKGHDVLLVALDRLRRARTDWTVELIGDGPERARLEAEVARLDLGQFVQFAGVCADVPSQLSTADLLVLPSLTEGLPNAVLEAMAAGVPVVASQVGGVAELLGAGGGRMVPPGDPVRLEQAVAQFLADPSVRQHAGAIGRETAIKSFSTSVMRERTLSLFEQLLSTKPA